MRPGDASGAVASGPCADLRTCLTRPPERAAPLLLGAILTSTLHGGSVTIRITEVEAYGGVGQDPGSHAHTRRTDRNATMFGAPGLAYVYFTYGMHWCLNVVAHCDGVAGAVLIRAGEVVQGVADARARRPAARTDRDLARGPARLAGALGVTREQDGMDLLDPTSAVRLMGLRADRLEEDSGGPDARTRIRSGPRTGVAGAGAPIPWRFWLDGDPSVSPHRPAAPRGRAD